MCAAVSCPMKPMTLWIPTRKNALRRCIPRMSGRWCGNRTTIRRSSNSTGSIWANRTPTRHMNCCIPVMRGVRASGNKPSKIKKTVRKETLCKKAPPFLYSPGLKTPVKHGDFLCFCISERSRGGAIAYGHTTAMKCDPFSMQTSSVHHRYTRLFYICAF